MERFARSPAFEALLALSPYGLQQGRIWTVATYVLLHGGILHGLFRGAVPAEKCITGKPQSQQEQGNRQQER